MTTGKPDWGAMGDKPPTGGSKFKMPSGGGMMPYFVSIILVGLMFMYVQTTYVSKANDSVNIKGLVATDEANASDIRAFKDSITVKVNEIPNSVSTQVNNAISSYNSRIATMEASVASMNEKLTNFNTSNSSTLASIATINTQIATIKSDAVALKALVDSNPANATLTAKITALETSVKDLNTKVTTLQADVVKLTPSTTTPTTTTPTTTPTTNTLIATVAGTNPMPLSGGTNTINIILENKTAKALYAEQINIQLQFTNPPTNINTWGLTLTSPAGTFGTPSYAIVNGMVSYLLNAGVYMSAGTSQTISIVLNSSSMPVGTINFVVTVTVNGFSALQ